MNSTNGTQTIKFLYSYGGRIVPRRSDGKLRYIGGFTRVLSVDKSISFAELMVKFGESCGSSMSLKCKLPSEDLDVLVSITCDEDLMNVIQEYDRVSTLMNQELKIRAVLFPLNSPEKISSPTSPMSCFDFPASKMKPEKVRCFYSPPLYTAAAARCCYTPALGYPVGGRKDGGKFYYPCCERGSPKHLYYVAPRNHSQ
ncbi:putative mitochondrial pyruvate carrier 1-like isoform 1 [Capsicum annuum]|uniref:uncharacterized protein LOC107862585 n=1 Tax=Capsicum annuum TaxID=4072 RepID=UPI0007BEFF60|nr:uncharacterized protein LOC107862585 [Capsicum annuum]KAF3634001.1 putative mitochondrial pyruvate carrier 1-like isoform 1 [Capsicum annuum]KAF3639339.1 putative mitochondrial pyruvate carrier 1-like isoform 1 [Capsicum annuum]